LTAGNWLEYSLDFPATIMTRMRTAYLCSIGAIFLIAHLSYYVQFPGLLSTVGVEPAATRVLPHSFPVLHKILKQKNIDGDSFIEITCLLGVLLSSIVASGLFQHASFFIALTAIYFFLTKTGGSFFTFQWDILLTEVGFVTALCCAPWLKLRPNNNNDIGAWPVRFLLFKLMFMSGVVKIQANCPTWLNLTALEYHFATQCLPGPLAFHAHQLHPFFLRLSVAATFVIEIPAAFLLIAPLASFRTVGAWLQIVLQLVIITTGNYTFFNLLTIALCLACFERGRDTSDSEQVSGPTLALLTSTRLQYIACLGFLLWAAADICQFESVGGRWNVKLAWNKADTDEYINNTLPFAIPAVFLFTGLSCIRHIFDAFSRADGERKRALGSVSYIMQLTACCLCVGILSIPMTDLTPKLAASKYFGSQLFQPIWLHARQYHLSSGYGLFRRMTGVGRASGAGWAGLGEPSVVARPEIIILAQFEEDTASNSTTWTELNFRWKPGNINQRPLQVAPHQPRLDWRMWFAALGKYNHNPWLISLIDRLLQNCPDAINLLNEEDIVAGRKRIARIRSQLFVYDFTRIPSAWSQSIPGTVLLKDGKVQEKTELVEVGRLQWWKQMMRYPNQFWTRSFVREYSPALEANNTSVRQFLLSAGYSTSCTVRYNERCGFLSYDGLSLCKLTMALRKSGAVWLPVALLVAAWMWLLRSLFNGHRREGHGAYCGDKNGRGFIRNEKKQQ